jgi:hypothetical protein
MKRISVLLALTLASQLAMAQADRSKPPVVGEPPTVNEPTGAIVPSDKAVDLNPTMETPAAATPISEEPAQSPSSNSHLIGLHLGFGVPALVGYGLDYVPPMNNFSFSLDFGGLSSTVSDVKLSLSHVDAVARYHLFGGSFFLGLRFGQQTLKAEATDDVTYLTTTLSPKANMQVKSNYITPHLGWQANSGGFFLATDFGLQLPSSSSTDLTIDYGTSDALAIAVIEADAEFQKARQDAVDAGDKFGKATLPYWGMLRLGYYF